MLREFVAHLGADFVIALAVMTIRGDKATKVGNNFKLPNEDMGRHAENLPLVESSPHQ
jgi:hypothetical protein